MATQGLAEFSKSIGQSAGTGAIDISDSDIVRTDSGNASDDDVGRDLGRGIHDAGLQVDERWIKDTKRSALKVATRDDQAHGLRLLTGIWINRINGGRRRRRPCLYGEAIGQRGALAVGIGHGDVA